MGGKISGRVEKDLIGRIKNAGTILYFLDYDGTLTAIRKKPHLARLDKRTKIVLKKLSRKTGAKVFIISGRSLKDVKNLVGLKPLYYIGNHGIELEGPALRYLDANAGALRASIAKIYRAVKRELDIKGVRVENKTYTLSVHYRLARGTKAEVIKKKLFSCAYDFLKRGEINITGGKKVFEVRPKARWDKGSIVKWVIKKTKPKKPLLVVIGDDRTDEDAFRVVGRKDISILVSKKTKSTFARYRLPSPREVIEFLENAAGASR
ncbi:MAG: trehalose-phosphatase [Candidatus Omnitrophica bacterium]|nr:trehalose-phosphatase [Candidatus Omnitrophota bacterium]